jgi:hypothetical protein
MINRSQLKFHETFQPELNYISRILGLAAEGYKGSKFDISECTGIPTGNQKGKVFQNKPKINQRNDKANNIFSMS